MQIAFLIIITLLGVGYAFWTKQFRVAAGLLVLTVSFVLTIPEMVTGFWVDILLALSLMIYTVGIFVIIYKKKEKLISNTDDESKKSSTSEEKNETK